MEEDEKSLRVGSFATHATRGLIREAGTRRKIMMVAIFAALLLMVAGSTFLGDALNPREHATAFVIFWIACAWLTVLSILLAVFDLLIVRRQARAEQRRVREDVAQKSTADSPGEFRE